MTTHTLKTWPNFFDAIAEGRKTFEIRKNDRGFQTGDILELVKWDPNRNVYVTRTGSTLMHFDHAAKVRVEVTYILNGFGVEPESVVMGIKLIPEPVPVVLPPSDFWDHWVDPNLRWADPAENQDSINRGWDLTP